MLVAVQGFRNHCIPCVCDFNISFRDSIKFIVWCQYVHLVESVHEVPVLSIVCLWSIQKQHSL